MGLHTTDDKEYTELMAHHGKGNFIYSPETYKNLHPGSVGYWNKLGQWVEITDISVPGRPEADGFGPAPIPPMDEPSENFWRTMSSESGSESGGRLKTEVSGLAAGGPIDAGVKAENKNTSNKKAALITDEVVKCERFVTRNSVLIAAWVKENAKKLVNSPFGDDISRYGLYAVHTTYVTSQCAITMTTDKSRNLDLGLDVGATGIAKLGAGGSSLQKLKGEGWATYESNGKDGGLVVSYAGAQFRLARLARFRKHALSEVKAGETTELRAICDENGNITGYEEVKVEAPKGEEPDGEEDDEIVFESEPVGMTEDDIKEEEKAAKEAEKEKQAEFAKKAAELNNIPEGAERDAARQKLLQEMMVVQEPVIQQR
ncbi:hypothetical protein PENANT_c001G10278 [Penicillium antarcticum]|uniref:Uncharacterized protein n=1 Tax=Penicillium antarcticum TaxID=416450 RepID=A0A1V6QNK7_9EURO|nr:uncharacterized protein N7508_010351 [Penicillium antarcticum]KAJ5295530.1 hypothetical protein N7508_010351 [Penicillium antarcticum]OQD90775.1 hypothetical protein PENANT_c001G10278 [Penicillium antarcticum]